LLSFCSFLAPVSSTTILSAVPEVAATYKSTGTILNLSNALYMLFMGLSPCFWVRYISPLPFEVSMFRCLARETQFKCSY
jgi:hypothetical protein